MAHILLGLLLVFVGVPVLLTVLVGGGMSYMALARKRRWRGEIYPATRTVTRRERRMMRIRVADEAASAAVVRWGGESVQFRLARVRRLDQVSWRQANVFIVRDGQGLIIDPIASMSRRYVFDGAFRIGPTDAVMTFKVPAGWSAFTPVRVADDTQSVDLAVQSEDLAALQAIGTWSAPDDDVVGGELRPLVRRGDRFALRTRYAAAWISAQSKARRSVSALFALVCAGGFLLIDSATNGGDDPGFVADLVNFPFMSFGFGVLVFGWRAVRRKKPKPDQGFTTLGG